jgi:tetratricopeptide (TPR) repeat protein
MPSGSVSRRAHEGSFEYDVFVSYSRKDGSWVGRRLVPKLQEAGLKVYFDTQDLGPGQPVMWAINSAIERSRHTLAVVTSSYLKSEYAMFELGISHLLDPANRRDRIIPLLKEKCDMPPALGWLTWADLSASTHDLSGAGATAEAEWKKLLIRLGAPRTVEPPLKPGPEKWLISEPFAAPSHFAGRSRQRKLLDHWLESDGTHPVFVLRGLGGYGKSALAWYWLLHDAPKLWPKVVWWSFTKPTATMREFIDRTAANAAGDTPAAAGRAPGQGFDLLNHLRFSRTLVVLDGVENVLRQVDRESKDPLGGRFLSGMASLPGTGSKMLILTRFRPRALEALDGAPLGGCRELELGPLQPGEACEYLRARGVAGTRVELERTCKRYGFHPLSINLLAGQVMADLEQPGDIAAARNLSVNGGAAVAESLQTLGTSARSLLCRIACFRGAVLYGALAATAKQPRALGRDLRELLDHGLLQRDGETGAFHLHPLVRQLVEGRMKKPRRQAVHRLLCEYFTTFRVPARPQRMEDLTALIEVCHHAARSGQHERAFSVLHDHLFAPLHYRFGEYVLNVELLSALFPGAGGTVPRLPIEAGRPTWVRRMHLGTLHRRRFGRESPQAWALTALALSLRASGEPRRAIGLLETSRAIHAAVDDREGLLVDLVNLSDVQWTVGALRAAEKSLLEQLRRSREAGQPSYEVVAHQDLGLRLAYMGRWRAADDQFQAALGLSKSDRHRRAIIWAHRARKELMQARMARLLPPSTAADREAGRALHDALGAAHKARKLLDPSLRERHFVRACWLLGAAYRASGDSKAAEPYLEEALQQCRGINLLEIESEILLELAKTRREQRRQDEARELACEGLVIAQRGPYVLTAADIQLFMATMACDAGDMSTARSRAEEARELARCDGPGYRYEVAYQEAGALVSAACKVEKVNPRRRRSPPSARRPRHP